MRITVVIPTARLTWLRSAVGSIRAQTHGDYELLVVGHGSDPELRSYGWRLALADPRTRWLHVEAPGVARARNVGLRAARGEVVAMFDDDCRARSDWLAAVDAAFADDPDLGVVGGPLIAPPRAGRIIASCPRLEVREARYAPGHQARRPPPGFDWVGANFALRRRLVGTVGFFDEHLGRGAAFPSCEDRDYQLRCEALGVPMRSTPQMVIHHCHGLQRGVRAAYGRLRDGARGRGALLAKLTLCSDPRGRAWLREAETTLWQRARALRLPAAAIEGLVLFHLRGAYEQCLREFRLDGDGRYLVSREETGAFGSPRPAPPAQRPASARREARP